MAKTIFDYDSSDNEELNQTSVKGIRLINSNILYNAGNAISHDKSIFPNYKQQKTEASYKKVISSTLINKFLTKKEYTDDDKKTESLNTLLNASLNNNQKTNSKDIEQITKACVLYKQIEEQLPEGGLINTENFKCFRVLQKFINNNELKNNTDEGKEAIQEIGKVFSLLNKDNTVSVKKTKDFFQKIKSSLLNDKVISDFLSLINHYNVSLLNDEIAQIITNTENTIIDEQYIETLFKIVEACKFQAQTIINTQTLYKQIEAQLPEGGLINTENFKCFKVLNSCKDWLNPSDKEQNNITDTFNLPIKEIPTFLNSISGIENIELIISNLINLTTTSSSILNDKIINYATSEKQTLNFDFALDILCDQQLYDLSSKLSDFDSIVNDKIKGLPFFNTSVNDESNAQNFLASSLTYQKFLKTITKFTFLRTHGNEIDTNIQCGEVLYQDKSYMKTISTKSTLSTGLKRTEEVSGLGSYTNVSNMLLRAQEKLKLTDQELIKTFQDILKGQNLYNQYTTTLDVIKTLYDITYLLFSCEANRNPEALISNAIFLELMVQGKYTISQMADHLPMAMSGAIEIGRFYHNHDKLKRVNDYAKISKAPDNTNEFIIKESVLLQKWLDSEKIIGEASLKLVEENKALDKKKKGKTKEEKEKIKQEINKNKEQIQEIADQCKKQLQNVSAEATQKLNKLIKDWYGIDNLLNIKNLKPKASESIFDKDDSNSNSGFNGDSNHSSNDSNFDNDQDNIERSAPFMNKKHINSTYNNMTMDVEEQAIAQNQAFKKNSYKQDNKVLFKFLEKLTIKDYKSKCNKESMMKHQYSNMTMEVEQQNEEACEASEIKECMSRKKVMFRDEVRKIHLEQAFSKVRTNQQEQAVEPPSTLLGNALLNIKFPDTNPLFEAIANNDQLHNFDYDNHQLDLLGHHDVV